MSKNIGVYPEDAQITTQTMVMWQKIAKYPRYVGTVRKPDTDITKNPLALIVYVVYHAVLENTAVNPSKFTEMATNRILEHKSWRPE